MKRAFPGASMLLETALLCRDIPCVNTEVSLSEALRFFKKEELPLHLLVLSDVKEVSPEPLVDFDGEGDSSEFFPKGVMPPSDESSAVRFGYNFK